MSKETTVRQSAEASDIAYLDLVQEKGSDGELHYVLDTKSEKYKNGDDLNKAQAKLDEYQSKYEILQAERDPSGFAGVTVRSKEDPSQVFTAMRGTDFDLSLEGAKDLHAGLEGISGGSGPVISDTEHGLEDSPPRYDATDPQVAAARDFSDRARQYLRPGDQAHLTGHSLGGMLAQAVGAEKHGGYASITTFGSPGVASGLADYPPEAAAKTTHVRNTDDRIGKYGDHGGRTVDVGPDAVKRKPGPLPEHSLYTYRDWAREEERRAREKGQSGTVSAPSQAAPAAPGQNAMPGAPEAANALSAPASAAPVAVTPTAARSLVEESTPSAPPRPWGVVPDESLWGFVQRREAEEARTRPAWNDPSYSPPDLVAEWMRTVEPQTASRLPRPARQAPNGWGGMLQTLQDYGDMGRAYAEERRFAPRGAAPAARRPAPATSALAPRVRPVTARDMWRNGDDPQNAYGLLFPEGWNWPRGK